MQRLDREQIKAAPRTAGALRVGNSFVGYFALAKRDLASLAVLGLVTLFALSLKASR